MSVGAAVPRRLLVVDDDPAAVELLVMLLQMEGFEVLGCADPTAALALAGSTPPDLLITDVNMRALGGIELAAAARAAWPGVRVWALTGFDADTLRGVDGRLPFDRVIPKPVDVDALLHTLRQPDDAGAKSGAQGGAHGGG